MITAKKSPFLQALLVRYFTRRMRGRFAALHVKGAEHVRAAEAGVPVVLYGNHPAWWDAVVPLYLSNVLFRHDAYAMMEERQLARYGFFRAVGCFSVDRENPRSAMRSLRYAADLLRGTDRVLWIYPQGELLAVERRPLRFQGGTARLLRDLADVTAIPFALRYEFVEQEAPEIFVAFGPPWRIRGEERVELDMTTSILEQLVEFEMDVQRDEVMERDFQRYDTVLRGRESINARWDRIRRERRG